MLKQFVNELQDKDKVSSLFLAKEKKIMHDKKGNSYISLRLSDKTGFVEARVWDNVQAVENTFQSGDLINVKGVVQIYQERKQIVVHKIIPVPQENIDWSNFIVESAQDPEDMFQQLSEIVNNMESNYLRPLLQATLSDSTIKELLIKAPAAKVIHHARKGGLIEHILSLCHLSKKVCAHYPQLNNDIIIFAAIYHDIAKIWELGVSNEGVKYTTEGQLIGHLVMGVELFEKKSSQILNFPGELKTICKHMLVAHHGKLENGSPKVPMILEAHVLWSLDDLDSRIDAIGALLTTTKDNTGWSSYSTTMERHFYFPNWEKLK